MIEIYPNGPKQKYPIRYRLTLKDSYEWLGISQQIDAQDLGWA